MTTNIVEAVARAISRHTFAMVTGTGDCGDFDEMSPEAQAVYRKAAREVLSASPLAEMREALKFYRDGWTHKSGKYGLTWKPSEGSVLS